jgi:entericidin B
MRFVRTKAMRHYAANSPKASARLQPAAKQDNSQEKEFRMTIKILVAFALSGILLSASACNTVKGAGQDIESVGQAGEDAID